MPLGDYPDKPLLWTDIDQATKYFRDENWDTLKWIEMYLGYIPAPVIYLPHLNFIKILLNHVEKGLMEPEVFVDEMIFHVKQIRNEDMKQGGWIGQKKFNKDDYDYYNSYLSIYKQPARERLCTLLTYAPKLEYSLSAEIYLRQLFQFDTYHSEMPYCDMDYKAATIAWYREIYLCHGEKNADNCDVPKIKFDLIAIAKSLSEMY